jgi:hypothetical protein
MPWMIGCAATICNASLRHREMRIAERLGSSCAFFDLAGCHIAWPEKFNAEIPAMTGAF